jgi:hypothetical protein
VAVVAVVELRVQIPAKPMEPVLLADQELAVMVVELLVESQELLQQQDLQILDQVVVEVDGDIPTRMQTALAQQVQTVSSFLCTPKLREVSARFPSQQTAAPIIRTRQVKLSQ